MEASKRPMIEQEVDPKAHDSRPWSGKVSMGGPKPRDQHGEDVAGASGWNRGDIDFRKDGTIFIRNPYLADALENFLRANFEAGGSRHFLRIVRDEGWSGNPTNIVC